MYSFVSGQSFRQLEFSVSVQDGFWNDPLSTVHSKPSEDVEKIPLLCIMHGTRNWFLGSIQVGQFEPKCCDCCGMATPNICGGRNQKQFPQPCMEQKIAKQFLGKSLAKLNNIVESDIKDFAHINRQHPTTSSKPIYSSNATCIQTGQSEHQE